MHHELNVIGFYSMLFSDHVGYHSSWIISFLAASARCRQALTLMLVPLAGVHVVEGRLCRMFGFHGGMWEVTV